MSTKFKIRDQRALYFVTCTVVYWIDVFSRDTYKDILLDSLEHCKANKGLEVYAYVIMTNHLHLIVGTDGRHKMQDIIRDFKKFTSRQVLIAIADNKRESRREWMLWMFERAGSKNRHNTKFQFWQNDFKPIELADNFMVQQKLDYIHENPVRARLVLSPEEWLYSSAKNYAGMPDCLLNVRFIDQ